MSRYQKGKTNLDFTEARDGEWLPQRGRGEGAEPQSKTIFVYFTFEKNAFSEQNFIKCC